MIEQPSDDAADPSGQPLPFVSVIVPVHNDAERLHTCLVALTTQTYPDDLVEVIVVDNNSTVDLRPALPTDPRVRMISERRKGSYAARNAGVAVATGTVLAFTDADCIPRPDWLRKAVDELRGRAQPDAVGGAISLLFREGGRPTTGPEHYEALHDFLQQKYVTKWSFAATANLIVNAAAFASVGSFNPDLLSGGDLDWGTRLGHSGGTLVYSSRCVVDHPSRPTWGELAVKTLRVANGLADRGLGDGRGALLSRAGRDARAAVAVWLRVWPEDEPQGSLAKARYAAAFSFVRLLRAYVSVRRSIATVRTAARAGEAGPASGPATSDARM